MRTTIVIGIVAAALLSLAPAAKAADDLAQRLRPAPAHATPLPKFQIAACRFWQCNCHRECVIYEGSRCVQSVQSCDTCSSCDN